MPTPKQSPWLIPIIVVLAAVGFFLAIVFTRAGIDLQHLLGEYAVHSVLFGLVAIAAILVYRALRRQHAPAVMDEGRSARDYRS